METTSVFALVFFIAALSNASALSIRQKRQSEVALPVPAEPTVEGASPVSESAPDAVSEGEGAEAPESEASPNEEGSATLEEGGVAEEAGQDEGTAPEAVSEVATSVEEGALEGSPSQDPVKLEEIAEGTAPESPVGSTGAPEGGSTLQTE